MSTVAFCVSQIGSGDLTIASSTGLGSELDSRGLISSFVSFISLVVIGVVTSSLATIFSTFF